MTNANNKITQLYNNVVCVCVGGRGGQACRGFAFACGGVSACIPLCG